MLVNHQRGFRAQRQELSRLKPQASVEQLLQMRQAVQAVQVEENVLDYLLALVDRTRKHPDVVVGASPRSAVAWLQAAKAQAWFLGRDYGTPDDLKAVAAPLLRHRLILRPEAQLDGVKAEGVISGILGQVPVPR